MRRINLNEDFLRISNGKDDKEPIVSLNNDKNKLGDLSSIKFKEANKKLVIKMGGSEARGIYFEI